MIYLFVKAVPGHKFAVFTFLHYLAILKHQDVVSVLDDGQAVSNNEGSSPFNKLIQGLANESFGFSVHAGSGVIQDKDTGIYQHGASYGQPLFLATGEGEASFPYPGVIAIG